ncbi:MAG TPA: creatininase family protein [Chloroflexota bacterium]|nr:creatininase family protein [Chloroflexota bacterium]
MGWGNSLFEITAAEAEQKFDECNIAVIPMGSVEQHGPHLPMGTDAMAGIAFGKRVAEKLNAVFVPFSVIGVTPYHMDWKGTITLQNSTFIALFKDVVESLYHHGTRNILVSNGHEGNIAPVRVASDELQQKHRDLRIIIADTWVVVNNLFPELERTHAAEMEAQEAMCYDPALCHLERGTNPSDLEFGRVGHERFRKKDVYTMFRNFKEVAATGWYGSLDRAKVERVPEVLEKVSDVIAEQASAMFKDLEGF